MSASQKGRALLLLLFVVVDVRGESPRGAEVTDRKISFVSYHTRSISMNITRAEAWQLHKAVNTAKGDLCRHRDRNPTGGA